jgi:hypothetical protein
MDTIMKTGLTLAVNAIILLVALGLTASTTVMAGSAKTNQIRVNYEVPENPTHQPIYDLLKKRQSLERIQEFLSPFRLKWILTISLEGCDGEADAMYSDDKIIVCYEYIEELQKTMSAETTPAGIEPIDTLIGPYFDTVLHEFAHALFDYSDTPILGREEDAADQVSAYIYLQLSNDEARRLIMGTTHAYLLEIQGTDPPDMEEFADEHSTSEQRAINLVCLAYGSDPKLFADLPGLAGIPQYRTDICEEEYELYTRAYNKLIRPLIDPDLAKKVFKKTWLPESTSRMLEKQD